MIIGMNRKEGVMRDKFCYSCRHFRISNAGDNCPIFKCMIGESNMDGECKRFKEIRCWGTCDKECIYCCDRFEECLEETRKKDE